MKKFILVPCNECGQMKKVINGLYLKQLKEKHNLSQREFAKDLKVSSPYISDIERNRRSCPEDLLQSYLFLEDK